MKRSRKLALLLAVASALAGPVAAQTALPPEESEAPPARTDTPAAPTEAPAEKIARPDPAEELALLLDALRDPEAASPEKIEERILALWSESGSASMDFLLRRAREAMEAADYTAAIGHLTVVTDNAPGFAEGWNLRATAFFMMEEMGLALSDIEHALAINPQHFDALAGLGIILEQLDRPAEALAAFRAAQALNPHRERVNDAVTRLKPLVDGRDL